jgi:ParB family chromosome partitioning protein
MNDRRPDRRGLGRGLSALMADIRPDADAEAAAPRPDALVPIDRIRANPAQPRRDFAPEALQELAESIRRKGVLQPVILRPMGEDAYELVAGERRWRAAQMAGVHALPAVVRVLDDAEVLEIAIIENVQRADLNPIEEAAGYAQLIERFGHTQDQIADALGKSRSHVANLLRLLKLPPEVQGQVRAGQLSAGHARALIGLADPVAAARRVIAGGLSVREAERLARTEGAGRARPRGGAAGADKDADTRALEGDLSAALGMTVTIEHPPGGESGRLTIAYGTLEQLDDLCRALSSVTPR